MKQLVPSICTWPIHTKLTNNLQISISDWISFEKIVYFLCTNQRHVQNYQAKQFICFKLMFSPRLLLPICFLGKSDQMFSLTVLYNLKIFYRTTFKGCVDIVFTHSIRLGGGRGFGSAVRGVVGWAVIKILPVSQKTGVGCQY